MESDKKIVFFPVISRSEVFFQLFAIEEVAIRVVVSVTGERQVGGVFHCFAKYF